MSDTPLFRSTHTGTVYRLGRAFRIGVNQAHEAQTADGRRCWIKQVPADDEAAIARLRYETIIFGKLDHRTVVRLVDRGRSRSWFFLVLESPPGRPLPQLLIAEQLPIALVSTIAVQVADMLVYLHRQGIICRSLPPAAFYLDHVGRITCIDLSMAWDEVSPLRGDDCIEDVAHISPEQAGGAVADRRSDMYVFGVLLFELLARRPPFQGANRGDLALQHLLTPPADLRSVRPELSAPFADLINRCLSKSVAQRPGTAEELQAALRTVDQAAPAATTTPAAPTSWRRLFRQATSERGTGIQPTQSERR